MHWRQSDAMVIIEARTLVARFQTHLSSRVFVQMRGDPPGGLRSPHCSLSISVSLHGMAQGYAYARHEQSHRAATHEPLHQSPVYIAFNICSLVLFLWIQTQQHLPFSIHCLFEQEAWLMVAPQLPQAPCSSSSFSLAWLSVMISATMVAMADHQVVSPLQTVS